MSSKKKTKNVTILFSIKAALKSNFFTKTKVTILRLELLKLLNNIHQENKIYLMTSSNLNVILSWVQFVSCIVL